MSERLLKHYKILDFQAEYEDSTRLGVQAAQPPISERQIEVG